MLFRAGDPGDAIYVIISGRMQVLRIDDDGHEQLLVELGRGEMLGEMAILTGEARSATLRAGRDSELVRMSREDLFALARQNLQVLVHVSGLIVRRLNRQINGVKQDQDRLLTFALLPCEAGVPLDDFSRQLVQALETLGPTAHITSRQLDEAIDPGAAQAGINDPRHAQIASWLTEIETCHRYVVYQAEAQSSEWSRRCIRQADRVILVGRAEADPQPSPHETALLSAWRQLHSQLKAGTEKAAAGVQLVLLHNPNTTSIQQAGRTAPWLAPRPLSSHAHVRMGSRPDMDRLARRLAHRDLGLVLSGGGARGFGHIGVLRALREMEIPVDAVGGTAWAR